MSDFPVKNIPDPPPDAKRTWGIFLIPRDKAPDEGFILCHGTHGGVRPVTDKGRGKSRWRAWWLPLRGTSPVTGEPNVVPEGPHYKHHHDIHALLDELTVDIEVREKLEAAMAKLRDGREQ